MDDCCFNRPYDDQSYLLTRLESEAKLFVQREIMQGRLELAWSFIPDYENSVNPFEERKNAIAEWRDMAVSDVEVSDDIIDMSNAYTLLGIKAKDALHISCAVKAGCEYFLTTDKKLLNKNISEIRLVNPIDFVREMDVLQ